MKSTITFGLALLSFIAFSQVQDTEWGMGYVFSAPKGIMKETIHNANGFTMDFYFTPKEKRYSLGMEMGINFYGHDKTRQTYSFEDGSTAPMDIIVNNNFYNVLLAGKYFLREGSLQPFVTGKLGYSFFSTTLGIYDPDDTDHCEPVDSDVLQRDGSVIFSAGAGLRLDMLPKKNPGRFFINLSANYSSGGKVDYMNVDAPNHNHVAHTSDVYTKFINTQTQVVHEHHVGNVYSSVIDMIDYRLSFSMRMFQRQRNNTF